MRASESIIAWTPRWYQDRGNAGEIAVMPLTRRLEDSDAVHFEVVYGGCNRDWQTANSDKLEALVLAAFSTAVVRDGIDPQKAHRAFVEIDEYRQHTYVL